MLYLTPNNNNMMRITTNIPTKPLGKYPQSRLYGHLGKAPNKIRIRTINKIVMILMINLRVYCLP